MALSKSKLDWSQLNRVFAARVMVPNMGAFDPDLALDSAEERAAIMEYNGGVSRRMAEKLAYRHHGLPPP